jgi:hypothetical protein
MVGGQTLVYEIRQARNDAFYYSRQTDAHLQFLACNWPNVTKGAAEAELRRRKAL